ncbi:protein serine/threonine phosphatase 2C [Cylindrobasidium torrendii FP15055 ss-10]|uniref:Protein serine/threonine phosphatase 2C n=1 Tax=Cylindrobasidium torrendii FP15055 ss-10 TaxID=1314674 RepID=A0A0D7B248_9AGAR|nr:protein serine/threonine phosphatase 2C [Cylindrobasidium torrendii FP15055 ss-10]
MNPRPLSLPKAPSFTVGISEDKGVRRTMEDAHTLVSDFDNVRGQGFFAVFDGHAGKHAAEWCGQHFHESLLKCLRNSPDLPIPDVLNEAFHAVDANLSRICEESEGKIHSGCTAVTAFLRFEEADGKQAFRSHLSPLETPHSERNISLGQEPGEGDDSSGIESGPDNDSKPRKKKTSRFKKAMRSLGSLSPKSSNPNLARKSSPPAGPPAPLITPPPGTKRVLYSANVGDARGVLCRGGKAIRLTYDHKGSDKQEAKRITDAGGFVMSGRVNGVLAVTRSLGDSSMKEFVVGAPYTTETELCDEDEFLILACDGLWDVSTDQAAVDLIRDMNDAQYASQKLLKYALSHHTSDNVTVCVVIFKNSGPPKSA